MEGYRIGVDVGGTKTAYGLFDRQNRLLERRKHSSDKEAGPEDFFGSIAERVRELAAQVGLKTGELDGVGVCMPSYVLHERGLVVKTPNLPRLRDFPAGEYLRHRLGIPVELDNDAHAAALAEHRFGAGQGCDHMIYCPISTGISTGIIIHSRVFRGSYGWAGETGHMIADLSGGGLSCACGNTGCYESYASGGNVIRHIARWMQGGEQSILLELCGGDLEALTAIQVEEAYARGDALARRAVRQMAHYLGAWLFNVYQVLNINCIVLGGGMSRFQELREQVLRGFKSYKKSEFPVCFHTARLGEDVGIIGAAELLRSRD